MFTVTTEFATDYKKVWDLEAMLTNSRCQVYPTVTLTDVAIIPI